jgi:hypothetical protein
MQRAGADSEQGRKPASADNAAEAEGEGVTKTFINNKLLSGSVKNAT